jgi:DNA polymerase I-like protein with 3'-5' exonuclease and polymerase domains
MKILTNQIPPPQPKNKFISLDIEMFGLNEYQLHRPTSGEFACLSIATDPETVYVITDKHQLPMVFSNIRDTVYVMQNAKFDITHLRRWVNIEPRKKLWDTMLIERIMFGGYYNNFALEHLARRHLNKKIDKSLQKSFENATELTKEQIEYNAQDAVNTLMISTAQRKVMRKSDFTIWSQVDRPALWAFMDFMGFAINVAGWEALAKRNMERRDEIDATLPVNPRSWKQTKPYLKELGFKGLPDTQEATLKKFIKKFPNTKATEEARKILKSKKYSTWASKYGMNFIEHYIEKDIQFGVDMIYCDYDVNRAETGRTAASDPPMQGIVSRDTDEFRQQFIARPDNVLLICDYSQQESAILAHLAQDKKMIDIINSGENIYIGAAREMLGRNIEKGTKDYSTTKSTILGTNYGMSAYGLAKRESISVDEAENKINKYFRTFPDVASWIIRQRKKKDYVETVMGRRIHLNRYSDQCERNAVNGVMQGTAGDMMKMAMAEIHQDWDFPYPFAMVEETHDEAGLDVPKKHYKEIARFVKKRMESVARKMCPSVKIKADIVVGRDWSCKS